MVVDNMDHGEKASSNMLEWCYHLSGWEILVVVKRFSQIGLMYKHVFCGTLGNLKKVRITFGIQEFKDAGTNGTTIK